MEVLSNPPQAFDALKAPRDLVHKLGSKSDASSESFGGPTSAEAVCSRLQRPHNRLPASMTDVLVREYALGSTLSSLGRRYGVHPSTVRRKLISAGVLS